MGLACKGSFNPCFIEDIVVVAGPKVEDSGVSVETLSLYLGVPRLSTSLVLGVPFMTFFVGLCSTLKTLRSLRARSMLMVFGARFSRNARSLHSRTNTKKKLIPLSGTVSE